MTDLFPSHGGFRQLRSFQVAQQVYDGTTVFCSRFIDRRSRTHDQMVQAARSGVQNIAEGSLASATSKKTELKLTGVARASLGELLLDFEDYLRQHGLRQHRGEISKKMTDLFPRHGGAVSANCCWILKIICGSMVCGSGIKTIRKQ